ncbi:hypothetical protein EW145_g5488 [Phellinidium pouzarii]|uniref:Uncharacterized protein n=1 Tax=Phellinidium pouzarii TaxID=167371 RepID=A0A4S4KZS0_9AGAM|nr:hypothetical protein EW145_g5488 [Phellinidium pouzarii]
MAFPSFPSPSPSPSSSMSSFASNFVSLARSKLHSSLGGGSRDNLSLHRWVLLKNSITQDVYSDSNPSNTTRVSDAVDSDVDAEFEDEEVDSILDEDMFAFLFPDPGDAVASSDEGNVSEAQWLDSLLETLGDSDDDGGDMDLQMKMHLDSVDSEDEPRITLTDVVSSNSSFSDDSAIPSPIAVPYPPYHPPLARPFDLDSADCYSSSHSDSFSPYRSHDIEDSEESVPDAIEDTSDDESDALLTPFSRSRSSLNLVDPASVPLPRDEPHIYNASAEHFPYEVDPLPYSDFNSESTTAVYSPYYQNC